MTNRFSHCLSSVEATLIDNRILSVEYPTQYLMCSSFGRMSEFYESSSPILKGQYFSFEDFEDEYANMVGTFSYHADWSGYNIPGSAIARFYNLYRDDLSLKEKFLLDTVEAHVGDPGKLDDSFYLIGTYTECPEIEETLTHELAHAMFCLNKDYRDLATGLVATIEESEHKKLTGMLEGWLYDQSVIEDEMQAYLTGDIGELCDDGMGSSTAVVAEEIKAALKACYAEIGYTLPALPDPKVVEARTEAFDKKYDVE